MIVPSVAGDPDKLNYLANKRLGDIEKIANKGTIKAHTDGNVPNITINIPKLNEYYIGQLLYFFQYSAAISAKLLGVNPFDQPGVEKYKKNMNEGLVK